jgi:hypothetical protein
LPALLSFPPAFIAFLLGLLFDPEGGGDRLLQNIGLFPNYMVKKKKGKVVPMIN